MATYGTNSDFLVRFPAVANDPNVGPEISSFFLPAASAWVEEQFGAYFTLPFSSNVVSIPEFVYERAFQLITQRAFGKPETAKQLEEDLVRRITAINCGMAALSTTSGPLFASQQNPASPNQVYDANAGFIPVFDLDDPFHQRADPNLINNDRGVRGFTDNTE